MTSLLEHRLHNADSSQCCHQKTTDYVGPRTHVLPHNVLISRVPSACGDRILSIPGCVDQFFILNIRKLTARCSGSARLCQCMLDGSCTMHADRIYRCLVESGAMQALCIYRADATQTQCRCGADAVQLQCRCSAAAVRMQCRCSADAIQIQCSANYHAMFMQCSFNAQTLFINAMLKQCMLAIHIARTLNCNF